MTEGKKAANIRKKLGGQPFSIRMSSSKLIVEKILRFREWNVKDQFYLCQ